MAQLVVRQLEDSLVRELRSRAAKAGVSMEEEHRRILREALRGNRKASSFKTHLLAIPSGEDVFFRQRTAQRRETGL